MSDETEVPADVAEAVKEVKGSFDLGALLRGRPSRIKSVRVYTDDILGAELGGYEDEKNQYGLVTGRRRWGIAGQIDELASELKSLEQQKESTDEIKDRIAHVKDEILALGKQAGEILEQLEATALEFEIQSLPPIIQKDATRKARQALDIKGNIPEARMEEFVEEYNAQVLSRCVVSITSVGTGEKNTSLSVEEAKEIYSFLSRSQIEKLDAVIDEIVFKSSIAKSLSTDADFSQGI